MNIRVVMLFALLMVPSMARTDVGEIVVLISFSFFYNRVNPFI